MAENIGTNETPNRNDCGESYDSYLKRAVNACEAGDLVLGMHLYLAAYEKAVADPSIADGMALSGLREAWNLACDLKERSMAEYIFEKLEPYLTREEIAECAAKLQSLALERLAEYGFSREDLEGMAEMISQDFIGVEGSIVKVESIAIPSTGLAEVAAQRLEEPDASSDASREAHVGQTPQQDGRHPTGIAHSDAAREAHAGQTPQQDGRHSTGIAHSDAAAPLEHVPENPPEHFTETPASTSPNLGVASVEDFNPYDMYRDYSVGKSYHAATNEGSGGHVFTRDEERAEAHAQFEAAHQQQFPAAETACDASEGSNDQHGVTPSAATETADADIQVPASAQAHAAQSVSGHLSSTDAAPAQPSANASGVTREIAKSGTAQLRAANPASASKPAKPASADSKLDFSSLAGYDEVIAVMHDMGIGMQNDRGFLDFVAMLNEQHGLTRPPSFDTILFRSPAVEDASRFVDAIAGELGLPILRMAMEEGIQGVPVLVVMTQGNNRPRMNHAQNRFEAPAILVIDDLDMWTMPEPPETMEGIGGFVMANISRGAREAVNLIHSSVEDPDVLVLATASTTGEVDPFFYDLLEPLTVIDIAYPNDKERADIWTEIARDHPSMRTVSRADLMRFSAGMPRYDMYMAAREAIEEAYKTGLMSRTYVPVTPQNIFEKLAAFQPYESDEYRALEDEVIRNFKRDLDNLEGLVGGPQG